MANLRGLMTAKEREGILNAKVDAGSTLKTSLRDLGFDELYR